MTAIKRLDGNVLITTSQQPVWLQGMWECGDLRFTDPDQTLYAAVDARPSYPDLTAMQFYVSFKPLERMLLKALAGPGLPAHSALLGGANTDAIPQDPTLAEFWDTYQRAERTGSMINPGLSSVQEGLIYLAAPNAPTPAIITHDRIPQICAGIPQ